MKIKVSITKKQLTHSFTRTKLKEYNEQIELFHLIKTGDSRVDISKIYTDTASMFESSPLFGTGNPDGNPYFYINYTMIPLLDVVNALYNGIISEFELTDGVDIRAYLELFGEEK